MKRQKGISREAFAQELAEDLTPGLFKALSKNQVHHECDCGFPMPKYPGRYPSKCPMCSKPRKESERASESASS